MMENGRRDFVESTSALVTTAAAILLFRPDPSYAAYVDPITDPPRITERVYLDVALGSGKGDEGKGRLVIGLFGEIMPRTTENFLKLCQSNSYAGTNFYRVVKVNNISSYLVVNTFFLFQFLTTLDYVIALSFFKGLYHPGGRHWRSDG